ncbi:extracellular solute-binding protein [Cohnella phaseoli]|uniref:ABC-type glycerol-3-phosphate transport system substrate-binding protein n=1 Tax=Cohnella phaseoli TaxID=456490 RepID=A0A3D9KG68_9BACL|nr:extracellular solute-binding protein [Cohnella phaseoli]RED85501.1 ABC-type glycerol-3-phosphate transport system substrate-binding protein [Cohnella phaseoli]
MRTKVTKGVAAALALTLLFGCSNGNGNSGGSSGSGEAGASASAGGEKQQEVVKIKVAASIAAAEPNGVMQNPVAKTIEKELGIQMDMTAVGADFGEKLNAMIASNDLPDLFWVPDPAKQIPMMVKANQLYELDDLLAQYGDNITSDPSGKAMIELHKKTLSPDGKLYTIGMLRGATTAGTQPLGANFIRWDLYKQLGYPKLENFDTDLLNVLAEMQKLEPKNKDGQKVYAIGGWFADGLGWGDWPITYTLSFTEGKGYLTSDRTVYYDLATNEISPNNDLKDKNGMFWRSLKFYNKANQMGILDPESFTQKSDKYEEKVKSGRYLYNVPGWLVTDINSHYEKAGMPDKGMVALPPMNTDAFMLINNLASGGRTFAISKNAKNPEKAMQLLNWLSSYENARTVWNGPEGENWNMENGKPVPTDDYLQQSSSDLAFNKRTGALMYYHFVGFGSGTVDPKTGVPVNLFEWSDKAVSRQLKPVHQDMLEHYKADSLFDLYSSKVKVYQENALYRLGELPENLKTQGTNLQNYTFKNIFNLILAKDDAEFEKLQNNFIAGLDDFKVDDIFAYWHDKAVEQQQELAPIFELLKQQ